MIERIRRQLEKIEASMAPPKVPLPKFRIRFIDPKTHQVVGVLHYPREQDRETERTKR
jgi:hypothetical protein